MDPLAYICDIPKFGFYPSNNNAFRSSIYGEIRNKNLRKKYAVGTYIMVNDRDGKIYKINNRYTDIIPNGYWVFVNKGGIIVERGTYADNGKKFGNWIVYYGGNKKDKDRIKCETSYIDDKIVGIQKIYNKTKNGNSVYLFREIEYDDSGNLTGNTKKYNESGKIIAKTYKNENIIIKEKYDTDDKIITHKEYNLSGKPINIWFMNNYLTQAHGWLYNILFEYYKQDYENKYNDDSDSTFRTFDYDKYQEKMSHPFKKFSIHYNKKIPPIFRYTQAHITENKKDYIILNFYDQTDNHMFEIIGKKISCGYKYVPKNKEKEPLPGIEPEFPV